MKSETKQCQSCKNDYTIEPEDFKFYDKVHAPSPTWCRDCRLVRRFAQIEERSLFQDRCRNCEKDLVSLYSPEENLNIYCPSCWWSDDWDPRDYGKEYDFSKSFFEQFQELRKKVPTQSVNQRNCTNCTFSSGLIRCKNCVYTFGGYQSINCYYCHTAVFSKDTLDSDIAVNVDHAYSTLSCNGLYNTSFASFSDQCLDCSFLFNCLGCTNCFGCVNLRNQQYHIFNKKYSRLEYEEAIKKWDLGSYKILQEAKKRFFGLYYKTPRRFAYIINSTNVTGDDIKNARNTKNSFIVGRGVENCKNMFASALVVRDCHDVSYGGENSELLYEVTGSTQCQNTKFSRSCNSAVDVEYSDNIYGGKSLFGCVRMRQMKYCILNKQYSKEEYEDLVPKIKQHMNDMPYVDSVGRIYKYGEFFPPELSLWAYNESWANKYFPTSEEKAREKGYKWRGEKARDYQVTIKAKDLPDHIKQAENSILNEVIECAHYEEDCSQQCTKAFRILPYELEFLRSMNIALPRLCPNCRYYERLKMVNPPKLYHRKCQCAGLISENGIYKNTISHSHGEEHCQNQFETTISDEREEMVYCEKCYQTEFI